MDSDCEDLGVSEQIACAQGPIHNHGLPKLPAAMHSSTKTAACAGGLLHRHVPPTMMPGIKSTIRHRHSSSPSLAGTKAPWQRMWKGLLPPPRITPLPTLGDYLPRRPSRAHGRDLAHGGDPVPGSRDGYGRCAYDGGRDPNPALFQISNQRYGCTNHDATGPGPHLRTELDPIRGPPQAELGIDLASRGSFHRPNRRLINLLAFHTEAAIPGHADTLSYRDILMAGNQGRALGRTAPNHGRGSRDQRGRGRHPIPTHRGGQGGGHGMRGG